MRKKNREIKDPAVLESILSTATICHLAMMDGNRPYLLPFNFGYHDGCLYIHAACEGKKIDLLKQNNRVCFEVTLQADVIPGEKPCHWSTRYRSIVGYGRVDIITDFDEKCQGLDILMRQQGFQGALQYEKGSVDLMVILKVTIDEMTGKQSKDWCTN